MQNRVNLVTRSKLSLRGKSGRPAEQTGRGWGYHRVDGTASRRPAAAPGPMPPHPARCRRTPTAQGGRGHERVPRPVGHPVAPHRAHARRLPRRRPLPRLARHVLPLRGLPPHGVRRLRRLRDQHRCRVPDRRGAHPQDCAAVVEPPRPGRHRGALGGRLGGLRRRELPVREHRAQVCRTRPRRGGARPAHPRLVRVLRGAQPHARRHLPCRRHLLRRAVLLAVHGARRRLHHGVLDRPARVLTRMGKALDGTPPRGGAAARPGGGQARRAAVEADSADGDVRVRHGLRLAARPAVHHRQRGRRALVDGVRVLRLAVELALVQNSTPSTGSPSRS